MAVKGTPFIPMEPLAFETRRSVIQQLALTAVALPVLTQSSSQVEHVHPVVSDSKEAGLYAFQFFKASQVAILDTITDVIIPTDDHSPGAKAARVSEFIDSIVVDAPETVRSLWTDGLIAVNRIAHENYGRPFPDCTSFQQMEIVQRLAAHEQNPVSIEDRFFTVLKRATVDGYYSSSIGIHKDLEYQGNTALSSFPGCELHP